MKGHFKQSGLAEYHSCHRIDLVATQNCVSPEIRRDRAN